MEKYPLSMRVIHWIMAVLLLTLIGVGLWMSDLPNEDPRKFQVYDLHKSFGVIALVFIILRISVRMKSKVPALPKQITKFDSKLAGMTVLVLYACMLAMPVSGYLMSVLAGYPVHLFGLPVPSLFEKHEAYAHLSRDVHGYTAYLMMVFIGLHLLGSLKHYFVEKVNLLPRMW